MQSNLGVTKSSAQRTIGGSRTDMVAARSVMAKATARHRHIASFNIVCPQTFATN